MLTFDQWSEALAEDAIAGAARGEAIFLSVDEHMLRRAAAVYCRERGQPASPVDAVADFTSAVRAQVVRSASIELPAIPGQTARGIPGCVAFLAAMVVAATRMAESEEVDEKNYFRRLREVLDLPAEDGRPRGLPTGVEEPLWLEWSIWLLEQQLLPSARKGPEGPRKYLNYPISQALLRDADRDRLVRLFADQGWRDDWDADRLLTRVRERSHMLSAHLRLLLDERGSRAQALAEAIAEEYDGWRRLPAVAGERQRRSNAGADSGGGFRAGLYRVEDPLFGDVAYHLYPRVPRRWQAEGLEVDQVGVRHRLRVERPGWFCPLDPVTVGELEQGARFPVFGAPQAEPLVLPAREFWVLQPDPEEIESGVYATWGAPPLGVPFILLSRTSLQNQLDQLKSEALFHWEGEPIPVFDGWTELHGCMAVSEAWSSTFIDSEELWDALRPLTATLTVTASGGLRVTSLSAWISDHGPEITVRGFDQEVDVAIFRAGQSSPVAQSRQKTGIPFTPNWAERGPGDYLVQASAAGQFGQRLVRITAWDALTEAKVSLDRAITPALALPGGQVRGALVLPQPEQSP